MKKKIKHYSVGLDSECFAISLVDEPAIESNWVSLKKEKPIQVCLEKDDKHLLIGAVLIPDKPIYRNQDHEEFFLQFSSETIEKLAHDYLMSDRIYSFTQDHEDVADNVAIVESWIKMSDNDKSKDYGIDVPNGSWLIAAKVENEDIWSRIKSGELNGFSVEALVNLDEIKLNKDKEMNAENEVKLETVEINDSFWDKIKTIIAEALGRTDQPVEEVAEETVAEIQDEVETAQEEVVVEQSEDTAEEAVEPQTEVEQIVDEVVAEVVEVSEQPAEDLQAVIDGLNAEVEALRAEVETLRKENQKLSKQPSTKPIKTEMKQNQSTRDILEALHNGTYFK